MRDVRIGFALVASLLLVDASLISVNAQTPAPITVTTSFGFTQPSVPVPRGNRYAVVDVQVSFTYRADAAEDNYPDMRDVAAMALTFLQDYPDKKRYWELIAQEGAQKLLTNYAAFSSLTMKLVVQPDDQRSYLRTAIATASRS